MHEAEATNFSVGSLGEGSNGPKKPFRQSNFSNICLSDVISFIERLNITDDAKKSLVNKAKKTPHGSLGSFKANYKKYIN